MEWDIRVHVHGMTKTLNNLIFFKYSKLESFIYEHDNINTWFKDFKTFRHFDILPTQIISDLQPILRLFLRRKDTNNLSKFR